MVLDLSHQLSILTRIDPLLGRITQLKTSNMNAYCIDKYYQILITNLIRKSQPEGHPVELPLDSMNFSAPTYEDIITEIRAQVDASTVQVIDRLDWDGRGTVEVTGFGVGEDGEAFCVVIRCS